MNINWPADLVRPGDLVVVAQGVGEPTPLLNQLLAACPRDVEIFVGLSHSDALTGSAPQRPLVSFGAMGPLGKLAATGHAEVIPCNFDDLPRLLPLRARSNLVLLMQVSPADSQGCHGLGMAMDYTYELISQARTVVAEVNAAMPTTSAPTLPASTFDAVIHTSRPLPIVHTPAVDEDHHGIARHILPLIPDGGTIQLGIGAVPSAIGKALTARRGLRVRSTLAGDWLLDLHRAGSLCEEPGSVIISEAAGSEELYEHIATSTAWVRPVAEVIGPAAAASIPRLFAVNSALQVDLTGQVNAEEIDSRYLGATGGQAEFLRAAQRSPGGASIVALAATANGGRTSRIVRQLQPPTVTTPRTSIDFVATEFGVIDLRGRTLRERAEAMIAIAAPQHRSSLHEQNGHQR
ncbi:4-hydroxybutyrate coenzyme A transferase [Rhodococcus wratislaviensis]|uniref:4-hydroxybutyrate coenzyme A transferase n=1 Tax=Rhodococcus wratislaviensis TaxID=44752 RepID=A0A402CN73_RHOWR|nr:acetyl-CoA hydrolase/transferase C-terminal domain-containing protein [Rhodococcus wratislaviensis]GCE44975.1 4-hydroxybutyrate coenzyme A transferase [Rhodococcus wratislaviensis]